MRRLNQRFLTIGLIACGVSPDFAADDRPAVSFRHDVLPILTKAGCNAGTCHGTPMGRNGFRLSLRGYDPALDALTVGSSRVDLQACKLEYSIVSPK